MNVLELPEGTEEDESVLVRPSFVAAKQLWRRKDDKYWQWHRLRGPAIIYNKGSEEWYRNDELYTPTAHEKMMWELRKKNECS